MINISAITVALLCVTVGCSQSSGSHAQLSSPSQTTSAQPSRSIGDRDTYAVYEALLGGTPLGGAKVSSDTIAIKDRTAVGSVCSDPSKELDPRLRPAGEDFAKQNSSEWLLKLDQLDLGRKVEVVSSAELDRIFSEGVFEGWANFDKRYPGVHGYIELSAVGFTPDRNFAVVYSAVHCGPKCGTGAVVTLSKKDGTWRKNPDRLCSWIS